MKWGVRRYQNPDGTLTELGKKRNSSSIEKSLKSLGKERDKQNKTRKFDKILDKETSLLQSHNKELDDTEVKAKTKVAISLVLENPAPTSKYVYMTFVDKD